MTKTITLDADKLFVIENAYYWDEERQKHYFNTNANLAMKHEKILEEIKAIQFELNEETGTFELDYSIMNDACNYVSELEHKDLADPNWDYLDHMDMGEFASVYTADRLSYLNIHNQDEVSQIMREYSLDDIQTACAVWYDRQVERAIGLLIEWLRK